MWKGGGGIGHGRAQNHDAVCIWGVPVWWGGPSGSQRVKPSESGASVWKARRASRHQSHGGTTVWKQGREPKARQDRSMSAVEHAKTTCSHLRVCYGVQISWYKLRYLEKAEAWLINRGSRNNTTKDKQFMHRRISLILIKRSPISAGGGRQKWCILVTSAGSIHCKSILAPTSERYPSTVGGWGGPSGSQRVKDKTRGASVWNMP